MEKKSKAKQDSKELPLKLAETEPKKLRLDEVREIEKFYLRKEITIKDLKIIGLERQVNQLKLENQRLENQVLAKSLGEQEASVNAMFNRHKREFEAFSEQLKTSYNVKELAFCPDTYELKGENE